MTRRQLEIESLEQFDAHVARTRRLRGWFVQAVDQSARTEQLRQVDPSEAVFLGCRFAPGVVEELTRAGALVFPELGPLPFRPYRPTLYTAAELYGDAAYADSSDAKIYAWSRAIARRGRLGDALATTLHDHAITDALDDLTATTPPTTLVGVMGGHGLARTDPDYRRAAELGRELARRGRLVVTGGGPGAMEAANLGALLAGPATSSPAADDRAASNGPDPLDTALGLLAAAPTYGPSVDGWLRPAREVVRRWSAEWAGASLSIPTWFYGHEPTNLFATAIAKYFSNALREDTLLHRCRGGLVIMPGAAGTVQEIFQASTENYYAADETMIAPLVLVGRDYWTARLPAWPLLQQLAGDRPMARAIHLVDEVAEASAVLIR